MRRNLCIISFNRNITAAKAAGRDQPHIRPNSVDIVLDYDELVVKLVFSAPLQRDVATYTYFLNRKRTNLTDARGYRVEMRYGGL